eukprot:12898817-Prorocentrum_lima.AAC.1
MGCNGFSEARGELLAWISKSSHGWTALKVFVEEAKSVGAFIMAAWCLEGRLSQKDHWLQAWLKWVWLLQNVLDK